MGAAGVQRSPILSSRTSRRRSRRQRPTPYIFAYGSSGTGLAGPRALLKYAKMCGVGRSLRGLWRDGRLLRMAGRWTPAAPIAGLEEAPPAVEGLHFFPFGGFAETAAYLAEARQAPSERRWNQS